MKYGTSWFEPPQGTPIECEAGHSIMNKPPNVHIGMLGRIVPTRSQYGPVAAEDVRNPVIKSIFDGVPKAHCPKVQGFFRQMGPNGCFRVVRSPILQLTGGRRLSLMVQLL